MHDLLLRSSAASIRRDRVKDLAVILAGAVLLLTPALVNGFPFVYPDTGTYLASAFRGYVPVDRPYWYGVFLRVASLGGHSFWSMVCVQALGCSSYVLRTLRLFAVPAVARRRALVAFVLLAGASSAGFFMGQLMPDAFTGIGLLALLHFLVPRKTRAWQLLDLLVLLAACWMHLSHLLILPLSGALFLWMMRHMFSDAPWVRWVRLAGFTVLAWMGLGLANLAVDGAFYISRSGHAFLIARLLDTGILKDWLDAHCSDTTRGLCHYKDSLPANGNVFLWKQESPLYRQGGWLATR
ncbi:MAG TPA: hypothetical protein VHL57_04800, partial [Flavobacteriales bacterium]|nr:hypothetical protein [Flavobacteriales bacterium]